MNCGKKNDTNVKTKQRKNERNLLKETRGGVYYLFRTATATIINVESDLS